MLHSLCSPHVEIQSVTISLKSGKSWAVQTEETEPANNQFPVGRLSKIHQGKYLTIPVFLTHKMWKLQKWFITRENHSGELVSKFVFFSYPEFYLRSGVWGLALLGGAQVKHTLKKRPRRISRFFCIKMFLQDGVLVGSRLGEEMFTSSTKMLKVIHKEKN